jgi:uncharacterized membrane protein YfcA
MEGLSAAFGGPADYLLTALVIFAAGLVQSSAGLGFGLVAAPVLMFLNPALVPGGVIFLGTMVSLLSSIRDFSAIRRDHVLAGLAGRAPAAVFAASLVALAAPATFQLLFGLAILIAVVLSLAAPRFAPSLPRTAAAGVVSGLMGTLTGVGAPPFAIALQGAPAAELRATMNAVLLLGAILSMSALAWFGAFGTGDILASLGLLPAAILGFLAARRVIGAAGVARVLRPVVLGICAVSSLVLIGKSLLAAS